MTELTDDEKHTFDALWKQIARIARVAHAANRAYVSTTGKQTGHRWEFLEDDVKEAIIRGVAYIASFEDATPRDLHDQWCADKRDDGWAWGRVPLDEIKESPYLVHYDGLSAESRVKYTLFLSVVSTLLEHTS